MRIRFTMAVVATCLLMMTVLQIQAAVTDPSTYDLQFANLSTGCGGTGSTVCADIQIKAAQGADDFVIGSHTVWFNFNTNSVTNPTYTAVSFDTTVVCQLPDPLDPYKPYETFAFTADASSGDANFTTLLDGFFNGYECPVISQDWMTMGTVCFDVVSASETMGLTFDTGFTLFNDGNNDPGHTAGTLGSMDVLPPVLSAGNLSVSNTTLCRNESSTISVSNYTYANGGYLAFFASPSNNITDAASFNTATKYNIVIGDSYTYTNDGNIYPNNTELYFYSFTGFGTPGDGTFPYSENCLDISSPVGPFVSLSQVKISNGGYQNCDASAGTAELVLAPYGGMPKYDSNETFTVSVTGTTPAYSGPTSVSDSATVVIPVTDGDDWTVTFTDSNGCTEQVSAIFDLSTGCDICLADAGVPVIDKQYICWEESVSLSVSGYTYGDATDGYVGIFVSEDPNFSDFQTDIALSVDKGDNTTKTNNNAGYGKLNQPLYAYSYIGVTLNGQDQVDPDCTDIKSAGSFVYLQPVFVNGNTGFNYDCNGDGTASVSLTPYGGLPRYDNNETFAVAASGLTVAYTGASSVADSVGISITATDGDNWSVTFTDAAGCEIVISDSFDAASCGGTNTCNINAGTPAFDKEYVCFGETINYDLTGAQIDADNPDSYAGMFVSPDGSATSISDASTLYAIYKSTDTFYVHDVNAQVNQALYLYSFIGSGQEGGVDLNCTETSAPVGPFYFLQEIVTGKSNYACINSNQALVAVGAVGGMPLMDSNEQFTVSVTGAEYTGPDMVDNDQSIQITVTAGVPWEVTFTDSKQCSASVGETMSTAECDNSPSFCNDVEITSISSSSSACGQSTGTVSVSISGGTGPYNYVWKELISNTVIAENNNVASTENMVNNLAAGIYIVTIEDAGGTCSGLTDGVVVSDSDGPPLNIVQTSSPSSCGGSDGFVSFTTSGTDLAFTIVEIGDVTNSQTHNPSGPINNGSISNLKAGAYILSVETTAGCVKATKIFITDGPMNFSLSSQITNASCGASDGAITVVVTGDDTNVSYAWFDSAGNPMSVSDPLQLTDLAAGAYRLEATQGTCKSILYAGVGTNNGPVISLETPLNSRCAGDNNGSINFAVSGGTAPYTYSVPAMNIVDEAISNPAETTVSDLGPGTYTISVKDNNGCVVVSNSFDILEPYVMNVTVSIMDVSACDALDGEICFNITGGTGPYNISDGGTSLLDISGNYGCLNNLGARDYDLTIMDANGCSIALETITITEPAGCGDCCAGYSINGRSDAASCGGTDGTATVDIMGGSGEYKITWTLVSADPEVVVSETAFFEEMSQTISNLAPGVYKVEVEDLSCACGIRIDYVVVGTIAGIGVEISGLIDNFSCPEDESGAFDFAISGGTEPYTYEILYAGLSGDVVDPGRTTIENLANDIYYVLVTDADGCVGYGGPISFERAPDPFNIVTNIIEACNGTNSGAICLAVTGATQNYTIDIEKGGNVIATVSDVSAGASTCVNELAIGNYNITITDANNCVKVISDVAVTDIGCQNGNPLCADLNGGSVSSGNGSTVSFCVDDGLDDYILLSNNTTPVNGIEYVYIVTDVNNNITEILTGNTKNFEGSSEGTSYIYGVSYIGTLNNAVGSNISALTASDCDGKVELSSNKITVIRTVNCASNPCDTDNWSIATPMTPASCAGSDGKICFEISGGKAPYVVSKEGNGTITLTSDTDVQCFENLAAGGYNFNIEDDNGCTIAWSVEVSDGGTASINIQVTTEDATCGNANGKACLTITGGTAPYTSSNGIQFDEGQEVCINQLSPNTYTFNITDDAGCSASTQATIGQLGGDISVVALSSPAGCNGGGSACFTLSGGTAPYTLTDGALSLTVDSDNVEECINNLDAGIYTFNIVDANACSTVKTVQVNEQGNQLVLNLGTCSGNRL